MAAAGWRSDLPLPTESEVMDMCSKIISNNFGMWAVRHGGAARAPEPTPPGSTTANAVQHGTASSIAGAGREQELCPPPDCAQLGEHPASTSSSHRTSATVLEGLCGRQPGTDGLPELGRELAHVDLSRKGSQGGAASGAGCSGAEGAASGAGLAGVRDPAAEGGGAALAAGCGALDAAPDGCGGGVQAVAAAAWPPESRPTSSALAAPVCGEPEGCREAAGMADGRAWVAGVQRAVPGGLTYGQTGSQGNVSDVGAGSLVAAMAAAASAEDRQHEESCVLRDRQDELIGRQVFISASYFNHSCMPNLLVDHSGHTAVIRATEVRPASKRMWHMAGQGPPCHKKVGEVRSPDTGEQHTPWHDCRMCTTECRLKLGVCVLHCTCEACADFEKSIASLLGHLTRAVQQVLFSIVLLRGSAIGACRR